MSLFPIYENSVTGERLEVKVPLESRVAADELKKEIGVPEYIDANDFMMKKATVILWASMNPDKFRLAAKSSLKVALLGGAAFKLHCPTCNTESPFNRSVPDLDLITLKEHGADVISLLCNLGETCGSIFFHGVTSIERRFNAMQEGMRYRLLTIKAVGDDGVPKPGYVDIFCDKIAFCHELNVREELADVQKHLFTAGIENLILSKAQLIGKLPKKQQVNITKSRILGEYDNEHLLVGMEPKDMMDVAAALLDHRIGEGPDKINLAKIGENLKRDWRLEKTVTLNLGNMLRNLDILKTLGVMQSQTDEIQKKINIILQEIKEKYKAKKSRFSLTKQWWTNVEEQVLEGVAVK